MVRQDVGRRVLLWCAAGALLVYAVLWRAGTGNPDRFSPIFWYLLTAYDGHANALLLVLAACAFFARRQQAAIAAVRCASDHPWALAGVLFPLLCAGSLRVYHDTALSMDEYASVFQARAFAAGRLGGAFPPELLDRLIPSFLQGYFLTVSRATGEVSATYWPGHALLLSPFVALGIPWAANPALGALTIPAIHRLTEEVTGSREAAGWAIAFTAASPAFVVSSISYYSMPAHLLSNLLYALLLLRPTLPRALLAGLIGSLALTLHNPVPHLLFSSGFIAWLCFRPGSKPALAALLAGYIPLCLALGAGWHFRLAELTRTAGAAAAAVEAPGSSLVQALAAQVSSLVTIPDMRILHARLAGLSKIWTWGAAGLLVFAAYGYWIARRETGVRLVASALAMTFIGYFFVPFDQGHGWGYRYIHSAWFVIPLLAAIALRVDPAAARPDLRAMAAWAIVLSVVFADGLRLVQVETFITRHLGQVPPLAQPADREHPEVVLINIRSGFYTHDLVQNDPFLRSPRITMVYDGRKSTATLMASRFPEYVKTAEGTWGELWAATRQVPFGR